METKLELPYELITICKVRENELEPFLKKAIAIELFRAGLVSIGNEGKILSCVGRTGGYGRRRNTALVS